MERIMDINQIDDIELLERIDKYDKISLFKKISLDAKSYRKEVCLTKLGFYSALFYRLSRYLCLHGFSILGRLLQFFSHIITGAEISNRAIIGPGLRILHPTGVVIGPYVRIGANPMICQGCAIVSNGAIGTAEPIVGDNLWAGPGCKIMGKIILGDKVKVGPNSVVLKNVQSNKVAFGIPARIMPRDFHFDGSVIK
jgi:serine O-acetyltransferase